jgi:hypothetical protein
MGDYPGTSVGDGFWCSHWYLKGLLYNFPVTMCFGCGRTKPMCTEILILPHSWCKDPRAESTILQWTSTVEQGMFCSPQVVLLNCCMPITLFILTEFHCTISIVSDMSEKPHLRMQVFITAGIINLEASAMKYTADSKFSFISIVCWDTSFSMMATVVQSDAFCNSTWMHGWFLNL